MTRLLALDCETTGLDLHHGARPFAVTTCDDEGNQVFYEWEVDPFTRCVDIPDGDVGLIREQIDGADRLVFHNAKFDITAFERIGVFPPEGFPWEKVEDTLIAHHCLYSGYRHHLDDVVAQYFKEDITGLENAIGEATQACRRLCRTKRFQNDHGVWVIADKKKTIPGHPSLVTAAKDGVRAWKPDMWLPFAVARAEEYPPDHPYWHVLEAYANTDSKWTIDCWTLIKQDLRYRKLEKIYRARMEAVVVSHYMERDSVTGSVTRAYDMTLDFRQQSQDIEADLRAIARKHDYELNVPRSGNNDSLLNLAFTVLKLPILKETETGRPSFDKDVLAQYEKELEGEQKEFVDCLLKKRRLDTSLSYLDGYRRFWIEDIEGKFFRMHPNLNPTGTVQLRWSSSQPNSQNISKQEGYNLRKVFGPLPGWEWWSLDYQNVELRIPTFESGERALMDVFLRPKEPPYFGSYHLVVFDALHPKLFAEHGIGVKDLYESTWYQWVKNGNFAYIYGAGKRKINATFHHPDAHGIIGNRFPKIAALAEKQLWHARKYGYVETIPDKSVDPERGFPIMAGRSDDGGVMPTTPLNYHVSGSAMWLTGRSMVRCRKQLQDWRGAFVRRYKDVTKYPHIKMQVHDELVFAFPVRQPDTVRATGADLARERKAGRWFDDPVKDYESNLGYIRRLQALMQQGGADIGVPTPVGVELNADNWAEVSLKC